MKIRNSTALAFAAAFALSSAVHADATVPTKDAAGAADSALLKRYEGSLIVEYNAKAYDEFTVPLSKLESVDADARDASNNRIFVPRTKADLEGKVTRLAYLLPAGRSPLEVLRNYQDEVKAGGGSVLFECKGEECGGDFTSGTDHGGGETGLLALLFPKAQITSPAFTAGNCAINSNHADQRYFAGKLTSAAGSEVHIAVIVYVLKDDLYCKELNDRTVAVVGLIEAKAREQKMVTVKAEQMSQTIAQTGKVALYGILFDFDKADIKPESKAQLDEIGALLKANPTLKLTIAGHTDNQGGVAYNMDLSKRRAEAVVAALQQQYGVAAARLAAQGLGSAAPVASNDAEEGRAKNRRVELVKQ